MMTLSMNLFVLVLINTFIVISVDCLAVLNDVDNVDDIEIMINHKNQLDHHRYVFLEDDNIKDSTSLLWKQTSISNRNSRQHNDHRTLTKSKGKNDSSNKKEKSSSRKIVVSSSSLKVNTDFLNSEKDIENKIKDNHNQTPAAEKGTTSPTTAKIIKKKKKKANINSIDSDLIRDHDISHKITKPPATTIRQPVQQQQKPVRQPVRKQQPGPRQPTLRQPVVGQPLPVRQPDIVNFSTKGPSTNNGKSGKGNILPISYHPTTTAPAPAPAPAPVRKQPIVISSTKSPSISDVIRTSQPSKDDEQSNEQSIIPTRSPVCINTQQSLEYAINQLPNISITPSGTSIVETRRRTTGTTTWNTTTLYLCPTSITISSMIDIRYKSFALDCYNNNNDNSSTTTTSSICELIGLGFNRLFRIGFHSNVSYQNIHFSNSQSSFGSVMYIRRDSYVTLIQCQFYNNTSLDAGGVVYIDSDSMLHIENCMFLSNDVTRGVGAVIYTINSNNITIINSLFESNVANKSGGAIFVDKLSSVMIANTKFLNNTSHMVGGGGAITIEGSSRVDLYNSTIFVNNSISTNVTDGNAISLERMNSTEPLYLSCDDTIIFCNGVDSISGISDGNTNCLSNGIRDPLPVSCQV